jgi:hypothetical protein
MGVLCFHGHSLRPKPFIVGQTAFSIFKVCPQKVFLLAWRSIWLPAETKNKQLEGIRESL